MLTIYYFMCRGLLSNWIDADGSNFKLNEKQNIVLISPITCNVTSSTSTSSPITCWHLWQPLKSIILVT